MNAAGAAEWPQPCLLLCVQHPVSVCRTLHKMVISFFKNTCIRVRYCRTDGASDFLVQFFFIQDRGRHILKFHKALHNVFFLLVQDTLQPFSGIAHDQHHPEALQNDKHCDKLSGKAVRLANHMVNVWLQNNHWKKRYNYCDQIYGTCCRTHGKWEQILFINNVYKTDRHSHSAKGIEWEITAPWHHAQNISTHDEQCSY